MWDTLYALKYDLLSERVCAQMATAIDPETNSWVHLGTCGLAWIDAVCSMGEWLEETDE